MRRSLLVAGVVAYAAVALALTLVPRDLQQAARREAARVGVLHEPTSVEEAERQSRLTDRAVNGLMLAPLGALITALTRRRALLALAGCAALSAILELGQLAFSTHRAATLDDFLLNVAGAGIGATAAAVAGFRREARHEVSGGAMPVAGRP